MTHNNLRAKLMRYLAKYAASALCMILFVCANTTSSCALHQPQTPDAMKKYSLFK